MLHINPGVIALAALIPLVIGFIYYSPLLFANAWMKAAGVSPERPSGGRMALTFVLVYVCSFFIGFVLEFSVIHQFHVFSILQGEPDVMTTGSHTNQVLTSFMTEYGDRFRTFKHGALHGTIVGLLFVTPIIAVNALFERRSFKYIAIHAGYWIITLALMGGVICQMT
ncbi:MAG: hypothetical protein RLZZ77_1954 [Bacteroidota bacterium]|jgi:hypothetical protein